jgi:hypothetical protein
MAQDNLRVSSAVTRKLLSTQAGTFDGAFGISCDTADNPLKLMQLNETTGRYDIVRAVSEEEYAAHKDSPKTSTRRRLFFQSHVGEPLYTNAAVTDSGSPGSSASTTSSSSSSLFLSTRHRLQDTPLFMEGDPDALLLGRERLCAPVIVADPSMGTFCPVGQDDCRIALPNAYHSKLELTCTSETQDFHVKYILPLMIFMFAMFGYLCFCSPKGRYTSGYKKKVVRCWDEDKYEQSLNQTLDRMVQQQYDRRMRLERLWAC